MRSRLFYFLPLVAAARVAAQEPPPEEAPEVRLPVEVTHIVFPTTVGRDLSPRGGWLPIYLEFTNRGDRPDFVSVRVDVKSSGESVQPFSTERRFEVAPGAPRRAWMYVPGQPGADGQTVELVVRCRGEVIRTDGPWTLNSYNHQGLSSPGIFVAGGEETEQRPWLRDVKLGNNREVSSTATQWLAFHQLPDRSPGYHAIDLCVLRGLDEKRLEPSQKEALIHWVFLGGFLVLAPSRSFSDVFAGEMVQELLGSSLSTPRREPGFRPGNLFYVDRDRAPEISPRPRIRPRGRRGGGIIDAERWEDLAREKAYAEEEDLGLAEEVSYTRIDPFPEGVELRRAIYSVKGEQTMERERLTQSGTLLYGEVSFGAGRVGVLTVDDQAFEYRRSAGLRTHLWSRVARGFERGPLTLWQSRTTTFVQSRIVSCLKDTKRRIGMPLIASMVIGYLLLVGPGVYFFLRRKRRLPAIVWVEPLVIVVSLGAIFLTGYLSKGLLTRVRTVTLVHQKRGLPLAFRESYLSIFSADETDYTLESPRGDLLLPLFANAEEGQPLRFSRGGPSSLDDERLALRDYRLDLWQQGYAMNIGVERLETGVLLERLDDPQEGPRRPPRYRITNHLADTLAEGTLIHGGARRTLSRRVPSGGSVIVDFAVEEAQVPAGDDAQESEEKKPAEVLDDFLRHGLGFPGGGGQLVFWALVARDQDHFRIDRASTEEGRLDFYLLYD